MLGSEERFPSRAWLAGRLARARLDLAYLTIGLGTAILALGVWLVCSVATLTMVFFVLGLPFFLASARAFRWTAELDRRNVALVLGRRLHGTYHDHRGEDFVTRISSTARDHQVWRDLGWLVAHSTLGLGFGCLALGLVALTVALALAPLWCLALSVSVRIGGLHVEGLVPALLCTVAAFPLAALTVALLRPMAVAEARLATRLLGAPARAAVIPAGRAAGRGV